MMRIKRGKIVTRLEFRVLGLMPIFISSHQESSCTAPKWQAHPQKKRPNMRVVTKARITNTAPALIMPYFTKA